VDEGRKRVIGIMAAILASPAHENRRRFVRATSGQFSYGQINRCLGAVGGANYEEN
jgi:hypothetical protein